MSKDKRKNYCVTFKHAVIDVEVQDCLDEHEAFAYAENKIKELDFDYELVAHQCGGYGFDKKEET
tara:strand:+ start:493 stop:687 length:195 start_codon:yes stop_codon:yes gene_type:complete